MTLDGFISSDDIAELYEDAQLVLLLTPPEPEQKQSQKEKEKEKEKDFNCSDRTSSKVKPLRKHFPPNHPDEENVNPPSLFMCHNSTWNLTDPGTLTLNVQC